jgi:hypothetical protein
MRLKEAFKTSSVKKKDEMIGMRYIPVGGGLLGSTTNIN